MNYPSIKEYKEAILFAEDNFEQLKNLRPVLENDGSPVMTSGNFAVVFKMKDEQTGKLYAVKFFLREQEGRAEAYRQIAEELEYVSSTFLTPIKYLDKELFVDTNAGGDTEFPVLLMDWVEGDTLDKYIRKHLDDQYELSLLSYQFSRLAMWLMPQPFAHGDLKPDNILVKSDGTLVLVDYDGMYVPAMKGQRARELGSPDFRHPSRTETDFDEHIDDFSLASILLSLKAISLQPSLLEKYGASDRLLFSEMDYRNLSESRVMDALKPLMQDAELASLYSLFILAISQNNLSQVSFRLFNLSRPERVQYETENFSTEVTEDDLANAWTDEYGVMYSADKKRLLKAPINIDSYQIRKGTVVICHKAFENVRLNSIIIPDGVKTIGAFAFSRHVPHSNLLSRLEKLRFGNKYSSDYKKISIPESVYKIGVGAFLGYGDFSIEVDSNNRYYDSRNHCNAIIETRSNTLVVGCSLTIIPKGISKIDSYAFCKCLDLESIKLPQGIEVIGDETFKDCEHLLSIEIPNSVVSIGRGAFWNCEWLQSVSLSNHIRTIENSLFQGCTRLRFISIPESVLTIGDNAFEYCQDLRNVELPNSIKTIGNSAFSGCNGLISIKLPTSVTNIGRYAFCNCCLSSILIPEGVKKIESGAFACYGLSTIEVDNRNKIYDSRNNCNAIIETKNNKLISGCSTTIIPNDVKEIGSSSFSDGDEIVSISIPNSVEKIDDFAFDCCGNLATIDLPNSILEIGENIFNDDGGIPSSIFIPIGTRDKFEELLPKYKDRIIEKSNIKHIIFDNSNICKVERCHVYKRNEDWCVQVVFKNGMKIEYPYSLLQGVQNILLDKQSIEKLQLYVGGCEGFYINPKAVKIEYEFPSKYTAQILFNGDYIVISGITWGHYNNINDWRVKGVRSFSLEERLAVNRAEVVASQYGNSVCFFMNDGGQSYIPLDKNSELTIGDELDMNTAKVITLCCKEKNDIVRVME